MSKQDFPTPLKKKCRIAEACAGGHPTQFVLMLLPFRFSAKLQTSPLNLIGGAGVGGIGGTFRKSKSLNFSSEPRHKEQKKIK